MAKKRFNLMETMEDVNNFIQSPKEDKVDTKVRETNEKEKTNEPSTPETKTESRVEENDPTVPNGKFRRNITMSEEMLWRVNYIKERKNKTRTKGDKIVTIDQLMFEMVQFALDEKFGSTKKKFLESKENEEDFL